MNLCLWTTAFWKICHKEYKQQRIRDMKHMKDLLEEKREKFPPYEIDACINQFRDRLRKVIEVAGKHVLNNFSRITVLVEMCDC